MLRYLALGLVVGLLVLRLLRSRWGARLLGVSQQVLDVIFLVALVVTAVVAVLTEYWILLAAVAVLLLWRLIEELRARRPERQSR